LKDNKASILGPLSHFYMQLSFVLEKRDKMQMEIWFEHWVKKKPHFKQTNLFDCTSTDKWDVRKTTWEIPY